MLCSIITILLLLTAPSFAEGEDTPFAKNAKALSHTSHNLKNTQEFEDQKTIIKKALNDRFQSQEYLTYKKQAKSMVAKIQKQISHSQNSPNTPHSPNTPSAKEVDLSKLLGKYQLNYQNKSPIDKTQNGLLVFISFSMPIATLEQIGTTLPENSLMVLRGMKDNSMSQTAKSLMSLKNAGAQVIIHPELFTTYNIKQVPTYVLAQNDTYDKITGNISCNYALQEFAESGDNKEMATTLITTTPQRRG